MLSLYDRVLYIPKNKPCLIIDVDASGESPIYGIEAEDQTDDDWFYWADERDLLKIPEH